MSIDAALGRLGNKSGVCTSSTRPTNPFEGQLIYETDTNRTLVYDNSAWLVVADNQVLSIDPANGRVGIGTTTPAEALEVVGNIGVSGEVSGGSTSFPASLDSNQLAAVEALQAKVGVDGSAVTSSLDYKISNTHNVPRVAAYNSTNQTLNTAAYTTIAFNSENYDTHGMHDNSTNNSRLTVPSGWGGYYLLIAGGSTTANASVTFLRNGARFVYAGYMPSGPGGGSAILSANAGDYFEFSSYAASGGTLYGSGALGGISPHFMAIWLAPS